MRSTPGATVKVVKPEEKQQILCGFIADSVALYGAPVFEGIMKGESPTFFHGWLAMFAYSLQLYFDFSMLKFLIFQNLV